MDELLTSTDKTVVTLNDPDEGVLAAVRAAAGDHLLDVDHPRERLEAHFRKILEKARNSAASEQEGAA